MPKHLHQFEFEVADNESELNAADRALLLQARLHTSGAYAPYSHFNVAAVARTQNGTLVKGTNQENASYPVGICAERVLLSALSSLQPNEPVDTIAISYMNEAGNSDRPVSPCGLCRQSLLEYEQRMNHPIRLLLAGQTGPVLIVRTVKDLMPFAFDSEDLQ